MIVGRWVTTAKIIQTLFPMLMKLLEKDHQPDQQVIKDQSVYVN